jgi:2-polyprenyl-6-methoxyphenol hydroxylase-like FAD-dependent oxidoreductase
LAGDRLRVIVAGAGIGGLVAALSLHEIGAEVEVHESVRELRPLGVGINLLPHAVRELDAMGLLDLLRSRAVEPSSLMYCSRHGQEIWREDRGVAAGYPWPQLSIHRGLLQQVLLDTFVERAGEEHLQLGHRLVRIDDESGPREEPIAHFATGDGEISVGGDVVVAADGIHSAARAQRYPDEGAPCWNGALLWRGIAEIAPVLDGRSMVWAGHRD